MDDFADSLDIIKQHCDDISAKYLAPDVVESISAFKKTAEQARKAWCNSWLGYHSRVYYENLKPVPPGARFSQEWGLLDRFSNDTVGNWVEYNFDALYEELTNTQSPKTLNELNDLAVSANEGIDEIREKLLSIIDATFLNDEDQYLERLKKDAEECHVLSISDFIKYLRPSGDFLSRDMVALQAGLQTPPHILLQAKLFAIEAPRNSAQTLRKIAQRLTKHLANKSRMHIQKITPGTHVFIGHGRSHLWKDLKDFIGDRLKLPWDEFNRVPIAGITNIARLSEMLDSAAIAFIVMTAEDEQVDGKIHARMNVVHEAGLFQGRLGFTRAIVLIEEECEEFSNIQGLGQIRFPKANIKACFEEIRQVLEREGIIWSNRQTISPSRSFFL